MARKEKVKKKSNDFDIDIQTTDESELMQSKKKMGLLPKIGLWFLVLALPITVALIFQFNKDSSEPPKQPIEEPTEVEEEPMEIIGDEEDEYIEEVIDEEEPAEPIEGEEPTGEETSEEPVKDANVPYKNELVNIEVSYPSTWYVTERTNEALNVLRGIADEQFNVNTTAFDGIIPVAQFNNFDSTVTIDMYIISGEPFGSKVEVKEPKQEPVKKKRKKAEVQLEPMKILKEEKGSLETSVGAVGYTTTLYTEYGEYYYLGSIVRPFGNNKIEFLVSQKVENEDIAFDADTIKTFVETLKTE